MSGRASKRRLGLMLLLVALPLCAAAADFTAETAGALGRGGYRWQSGAAEGSGDGQVRIVIDRAQQRAFVYRGEQLIGVSTVSTGKKGHRTPLGTFTVLQKAVRHRSNKYSNAPMPYMQRLTWDGIALHAGPLPGYPASHGCIRLPWSFAKKLFAATSLGVIVDVVDGGSPLPRVQMAASPQPPGLPAVPTTPVAVAIAAATPVAPAASASALPGLAQPAPAAAPARPAAPARAALAVAPPPVPRPQPRPVMLAMAEMPPPAAVRPQRRASWQEQSAEDFVTWGTVLPGGHGAAGTR